MKYSSEKELDVWVQNRQKQIFRVTIFAAVLCFFAGLGVYFNTNKQFNGSFFVGTLSMCSVFLFVLFSSRFNSNVVNRTVREIEINETNIVVKTFAFRFMYVYTFDEKSFSKEIYDISFSLIEYPLKDGKNILERECYKLKIDGEEYYLLYKYFENEVIDVMKNKILSKKNN